MSNQPEKTRRDSETELVEQRNPAFASEAQDGPAAAGAMAVGADKKLKPKLVRRKSGNSKTKTPEQNLRSGMARTSSNNNRNTSGKAYNPTNLDNHSRAILPAYPSPFAHKGIGMEDFGETQEGSHSLAISHQRSSRMDPRELAKSLLMPNETPVSFDGKTETWALHCRSIAIEKTRLLSTDQTTKLDTPLEELPGRVILFTNQRIIIADSSYLDMSFSNVSNGKTDKNGDIVANSKTGTLDILAGHQHVDTVVDPGRLKRARFAHTVTPGTGISGWDSGGRQFKDTGMGGPSSATGLPLKMGKPPVETKMTMDYQYFRAFPRSDVLDVRMDFVSAVRTSGHITSKTDSRDVSTRRWDWCCKQGFSRTNGCAMPLLSLVTFVCLLITILAGHIDGKTIPATKNHYMAAIVLTALGLVVNLVLLYFWWFKEKITEEISDAADSERHVRIKLKDQGNLILNVSWAHPAADIARVVSSILPKENELQRVAKRSASLLAATDKAVGKARDDVTKAAAEDLRELEGMLRELRALAAESRDKNFRVAVGNSARTRLTPSDAKKAFS